MSAEGGISMEMEKVLRRMPNAEGVESTKVLELNPNHMVFAALKAAHADGDTEQGCQVRRAALRPGSADCRPAH